MFLWLCCVELVEEGFVVYGRGRMSRIHIAFTVLLLS